MRRPGFLLALICFAARASFAAITAPESAHVSFTELEGYRTSGVPEERWPALMETLGSDEQRSAVRGFIKEMKPFPAERLVKLLAHQRLAVRLGALEILEDVAGETFDFDPWQENVTDALNGEALKRWQAWASKGGVPAAAESVQLNDETFRVIAQEITGGNTDRAERAMRRLEAFGLAAVTPLEGFLQTQSDLEDRARAMLKQAEYRLVLGKALPRQAAALARDLAMGAPEAQSTALGALGPGGISVLPVLNDFFAAADPLVRESAVDSAFTAGGKHALPMVLERIEKEEAESVLHAMLRGLGRFANTQQHAAAILKFAEHPSENVVIAAVEALGFNNAGRPSDALKKALSDPRWRVRAAALETIGKRNLTECRDAVSQRLDDPEDFVRVTAVTVLMRISAENADKTMLEYFEKLNVLKAPILKAYLDKDKAPPARMWELLQGAPTETVLQCLETLEDRDDRQGKRIPFAVPFARHGNADVAATALRLLASHGRSTALLLEALKGNDPVKRDAVLDQLSLAPGYLQRTAAAPGSTSAATPAMASNPKLELLYERLGAAVAVEKTAPAAVVAPPAQNEADPAAMVSELRKFLAQGSQRQRFRAALLLAPTGDGAAIKHLAENLETLTPVDRRLVAGALAGVSDWAQVRQLALRLLRDPEEDVRSSMIDTMTGGANSARMADLLGELAKPGGTLNPAEIYDYRFDRLMENLGMSSEVVEWGKRVLADDGARDAVKVFAIILHQRAGKVADANLEAFTRVPNPVVRRAAYRALGLKYAETRIDDLLRDQSALVRMVLPFLAAPTNRAWEHYFDEATQIHDLQDYHERGSRSSFGAWAGNADVVSEVPPAVVAAVEKLARDPAERVRFEALFSILRIGKPVDPNALASAVASQAADVHARSRMGDYLENNYQRLGKGYGALVPVSEEIREDYYDKIAAHFGMQESSVVTSLAKLAQVKPAETKAGDNQITATAPAPAAGATGSFRVLFFHKVGCKDCERVRDMLARHGAAFPQAKIEEHDIDDPKVALLNEALSSRFQIQENLHQVTPAVFTQAGVLVRDDITFPALGDLLRATDSSPRDEKWAEVQRAELNVAQETIEQRYESLSLAVVGIAGLLDGVNPCAFATIIFLLSYLHVARRSPREVLAVGGAFISAVFITYYAVGLGLVQVLSRLDGMRVAGTILNYALALFALVLALFSFRDAQLASRGQYGEMTLQLPGMLKEHIRSAIRTSAKASRFVMAAFVAGVVISLLELACTGQVYLPTILYMLRSGQTGASRYLLAYNLAFVMPLIAVFGLAWAGMRSDALVRFQQRNVALVKVLTGLLFLFLTLFLLFGHEMIPELGGKK